MKGIMNAQIAHELENSVKIRLRLMNERLDILEADLKAAFQKLGGTVAFGENWIDADKAGINPKKLKRLIECGKVREVEGRLYRPDILRLN